MPRPANLTRISLIGHLAGGEIFDTSIWLQGAPSSQDATGILAGQAAVTFQNGPMATLKGLLAPQSGYDTVKAYSYPTGGTSPAAFVAEQPIVGGAGSTSGGNGLDTTAIVETTLTGAAGRRNRGRMYLPANGVTCAAGLCDPAVADSVSSAMANWFGALANPATTDSPPVVVSVVGSTARLITIARVDDRMDLQRRRSNKLVSSHTATTVVS